MPYVNIKITERRHGGAESPADRRRDRVAARGAGQNPATTVVVIDEVDTDNWGIGGETVTVRRTRVLSPTSARFFPSAW